MTLRSQFTNPASRYPTRSAARTTEARLRPSASMLSPSVPGTCARAWYTGPRSPPVRTVTSASARSRTSFVVVLVTEVDAAEAVGLVDHCLPRGPDVGSDISRSRLMRIEPIAPEPEGFPATGTGVGAGAAGAAGAAVGSGVGGPGVGCGITRGRDSTIASGPSQIGSGVGTGVGVTCEEPSAPTWASGVSVGSTTLPPALPRTTRRARATRAGTSREREIRDARLEEDRGTTSRCSLVRLV